MCIRDRLFDLPPIVEHYHEQIPFQILETNIVESPSAYIKVLLIMSGLFGAFAFLTTFAREIQKDLADIKGDRATGCRTLPIVWGNRTATLFVVFVILLNVGLLGVLWFRYFNAPTTGLLTYIVVAVIFPLVISGILTLRATDRKSYLFASQLMKVAMVAGICIPVIFDLWSVLY